MLVMHLYSRTYIVPVNVNRTVQQRGKWEGVVDIFLQLPMVLAVNTAVQGKVYKGSDVFVKIV